MRPSRKYSGYTHKLSDQAMYQIAYETALEARKRGLHVSTAEVVEAARLLALYMAVSGAKTLAPDDIAFVLSSVYAKRMREGAIIHEIVREITKRRQPSQAYVAKHIEAEIDKDLQALGLRYGSKIRHRRLTSEKAQSAYARLKLLGIIRRGRKGEYVVHSSQARRIAEQLARHYRDYKDAIKDVIRRNITRNSSIVASMGTELLNYIDLEDLSIDELTRLYRHAGKNEHLRYIVSRTIEEKINKGEHYSDASSIYEILRKEKLLQKKHLRYLLEQNPKLAERAVKDFGKEAVLDVVAELSTYNKEGAVEIALKAIGMQASRRGVVTEILNRNQISLLSSIGSSQSEALEVLNRLATAKKYLAKSLVDDTRALLDYAEYEYTRAVEEWSKIKDHYENIDLAQIVESEITRLKQLIDAAERGDIYSLIKSIVKNMDVFEALKLLSTIYNDANNKRVRSYAIMLMRSLWRESRGNTGLRPSRKIRLSKTKGRLHIRKTLEKIVRFNPSPLTRITKHTTRQYIVVVDKSGSMRSYALYTILAASALATSISKLIVFDENITIYRNIKHINPLHVVDLILSTRFSGYTNIVDALRSAAKGSTPRHIVLISDLKQTIATDATVEEVIRELRLKGWQITIVLPPKHDARVLNRIKPYTRFYIIRTPQDIPSIMRRILRS
ncbi:hypothetical protein Pyrde_1024 [Pyrodictium delaneyi]|uniref:VWA domain-containing protein n=1 Tax=Pyrodictium delaneyi TaxID=1273541 RepID=A0A0P0N4I5_9CREN|nr:VWA domain-containing protein [Pyrodictium delaneyi]ALL01072.1 hypothetical protein Pyrde_1024 [Pyrodictium delaneyi]OWJ55341.1 hypothetical protein Pdsh_00520 [Pyrodictium delaneyi]